MNLIEHIGQRIREFRTSYGGGTGISQDALAKALGVASNTVSRWESGRNVQTAAMDVLLRLLRDVPGSLEYLRKHAA